MRHEQWEKRRKKTAKIFQTCPSLARKMLYLQAVKNMILSEA